MTFSKQIHKEVAMENERGSKIVYFFSTEPHNNFSLNTFFNLAVIINDIEFHLHQMPYTVSNPPNVFPLYQVAEIFAKALAREQFQEEDDPDRIRANGEKMLKFL